MLLVNYPVMMESRKKEEEVLFKGKLVKKVIKRKRKENKRKVSRRFVL